MPQEPGTKLVLHCTMVMPSAQAGPTLTLTGKGELCTACNNAH